MYAIRSYYAARIRVNECNCSICSKTGYLHLVVPKERFTLLSVV